MSGRWLALVALVATSGCSSCSGDRVGAGDSTFAADVMSLDFGSQFVGSEKRQTFHLEALGSASVSYTASFQGAAGGYTLYPAAGVLRPGTAQEITVIFAPDRAGPSNPVAVFTGDGSGAPPMVALHGTGLPAPDCEDGNGCTVDSFDASTGTCQHKAENLPCDDLNACTTGDTCVSGQCLAQPVSCDDSDPCTDDFCEPVKGCVHKPAISCDDGNPCTVDTCDRTKGCSHSNAADGTPCNTSQQCVTASICFSGSCKGFSVPDGSVCDDNDPCTMRERCTMGECLDPTVPKVATGGVKFTTKLGTLAPGATENPIIDRDGTTYVGIKGGVAAVDQCGAPVWKNTALGTPNWEGAVSLPGVLSVPIGPRIYDVGTSTGGVVSKVSLAGLFPALPTGTASASVRVLDLAVRASGALVASVVRETQKGAARTIEGLIAEVDRTHRMATRYRNLGELFASRLAIDRDESVLAVVADGLPEAAAPRSERLVRFGLAGLPEGTWATTASVAAHTEIAIGPSSEALWTMRGLLSVARGGAPSQLFASPVTVLSGPTNAGSAISAAAGRIYAVRPVAAATAPGQTFSSPAAELVATSTRGGVLWTKPIPASSPRSTPVADIAGNVYVVDGQGVVQAFTPAGDALFTTQLPLAGATMSRVAMSIIPRGTVIAIGAGQIFGLENKLSLGASSWPRHRRDNFSTGHR